jgi:hypothetical protein
MYPETEAVCIDDTGLDITRVNIPLDLMMHTPEMADLTDHIALWFGQGTVVANVPVNRGKIPPYPGS